MVRLKFTFAIVTSALIIISCSKDEPDTTFEGTWLYSASEKRNCSDTEKNSGKSNEFIFSTPCNSEARFLCSYEKFVFNGTTYSRNSSSTLFAIPISSNDRGDFTISGSSLTICKELSSGEQECKDMEYSISGNTMSLAYKNAETGCLEINYYSKQ